MVNRIWLFRFASIIPCAVAAAFLALHMTVGRPVDQHSTVIEHLLPLAVSTQPCPLPGVWQARAAGGQYYVGRVVVRFFLDAAECVEPVVLYGYVCSLNYDDALARTKSTFPLNASIIGLGWNNTGRCSFVLGLGEPSPYFGLCLFFAIVGGISSLSWCYKTRTSQGGSELSTLVPSASV